MKMPKRAAAFAALGVAALLTVLGGAGCGDKAVGGEGNQGDDAVKHMGGPPPGQRAPAPPANQAK